MLNKIKAKAANIDADTKENAICFAIEFIAGFLSVTALFWGIWLLVKWGMAQVALIIMLILASLPISGVLIRLMHGLRK